MNTTTTDRATLETMMTEATEIEAAMTALIRRVTALRAKAAGLPVAVLDPIKDARESAIDCASHLTTAAYEIETALKAAGL